MEFVGKTVRKDFKGFGVFAGVVNSYNSSTGFFQIVYENGNSEELQMSNLLSVLNHDDVAVGVAGGAGQKPPSIVGRKPKKRRRGLNQGVQGNDSVNLTNLSVDNACENADGFVVDDKTLEIGNLGDFGGDVKRNKSDLNLNDGLDLNNGEKVNVSVDLGGNDVIDLNLDLNVEESSGNLGEGAENLQEGAENGDGVKKEYCFDLNLGGDEEIKNCDAGLDGEVKESRLEMCEDVCVEEVVGKIEVTLMDGDLCGNVKTDDTVAGVLDADVVNCRPSFDTPEKDISASGVMEAYDIQLSSGSVQKEKKSRKRKKLAESGNSGTDTVLRRSARRGRAALSDQDHVSNVTESETVDNGLFSPAVSTVVEDQPSISGLEESKDQIIPHPKLQLPPSSEHLNLDGIPVLDLFSVYAFLRSFSTLLFLSPFKLEDFVASLRSRAPSLLIDYIHVSLLQTLRKHLEFLSVEGSLSASKCLRDLNWDLLDLITWPVFLAEYLLIYSSSIKPGFDRHLFKLFEDDYHKQPESTKIDILRCLCDDVIEVDAIKSELNRRTMMCIEPSSNTDFEWNTKLEASKIRKAVMDVSGSSCVTEEVIEEAADWNSDECRLCKMDGNLICCDGCPAAFHARCVGIATSLLPEGDWYCPECVIDRDNPLMKVGKSIRGAELLGIDPCGQLYYGSCGYLLVEDPCVSESSCYYYHKSDLSVVIEALELSGSHFNNILGAITKFSDGCTKSVGMDPNYAALSFESLTKCQQPAIHMPAVPLVSLEACDNNVGDPKKKFVSTYGGDVRSEVLALVNVGTMAGNSMKIENPLASSEESGEISQSVTPIQNLQKPEPSYPKRSERILKKNVHIGDPVSSTNVDVEEAKSVYVKNPDVASPKVSRRGNMSQHHGTRYMNFYSFARTAWSVYENLTRKSSDKISQVPAKSVEEVVSTQLKAISYAYDEFDWSNIQNLSAVAKKEKCGWCIICKVPEYEGDCLFVANNYGPAQTNFTSDELDFCAKKNSKGRLIDVICHILCLEDRLRGLLSGPWLNAHFSKLWRKSLLKASDIVSVQKLLLLLESNICPRALSVEWPKHVDSVATVGSASHIVKSTVRISSKHVTARKRSKGPDSEPNSSNAASGLCLLWWRGGRLSRQLFSWKALPQSVTSKAARQGGRTKIPGVLYPDGSEYAKRTKCVAWQASVEASASAEQLAVRVRELDANIRWDDVENNRHRSIMDKEAQKSIRSFKKVIVRRRSVEGTAVKYLLDFGKKRFIPDIVAKHGSKLEDSESDRKRYWLEESYVPLHLLKGFEERRIARKSNDTCSEKSLVSERGMKKPSKDTFSYLFSKAERCENYQCGHCNKDVLISEAVSCQFCEGFFHKRHVKKSTGAISRECKYTCHKCRSGKHVDGNKVKHQLQKGVKSSKLRRPGRPKGSIKAYKGKQPAQSKTKKNNTVVVPLRRSARKAKVVLLPSKKSDRLLIAKQSKAVLLPSKSIEGLKKGKESKAVLLPSKKTGGLKKGKQSKFKKGKPKIPKESILQKQRTQVYYTYWLNGLRLSRKSNDDRVMHFRSKNYLAPFEKLPDIQPKCCLCCELEFTSSLNYICCEICGDWFHGDAFGLDAVETCNIIGFKCHKCLDRTPPVCPHSHSKRNNNGQSSELKNDVGSEIEDGVAKGITHPSETGQQTSNTSDSKDGHLPFDIEQATASVHKLDEKNSIDTLMEPTDNSLSILELNIQPATESPDIPMELKGNTLSNLEQKRTFKSDKKCLPDTLLEPNENAEGAHLPFAFETGTELTPKLDGSLDTLIELTENTLSILEHKTEPCHMLNERDLANTLMEQDDNTLLKIEQKREQTCKPDEEGLPDTLLKPNENTFLGNMILGTVCVGTERTLLSENHAQIPEINLEPLQHNNAKNGFLSSSANLKFEVDKLHADSSEIPPQEALLVPDELTDRCVD